MATKATGKMSKKARREAERRKKLQRTGLIALAVIAVCAIGLFVISRMGGQDRAYDAEVAAGVGDYALLNAEADQDAGGEFEPDEGDLPGDATPEPTPTATPVPTPEPTEEPTPEPTAIPEPVKLTITATGDCTFGGCLKHDTMKVFKKYVDTYGYDYFFDKVRPIFQADDLTIINLEGPLTDVGTMTTKSGICFRGEPEWTAIMTGSSIEVCNIANNHIMDMGAEGAKRTLEVLDAAGIGYCGYNYEYNATIKGVRVTCLGFEKWTHNQDDVAKQVKAARPNCDLLIVNFHWGWEMKYAPDSDQKRLGHAAVDAGADLVIGNHPHVFGGVELYNGKYICYSLGNFCFGGNTMPSDQRCMIFQQVFEVSPGGEVSDGGINIIPCLVSGDTHRNDFQPYVLGAKPGTSLLKNIARYSNLSRNTLWMPNSYPEQIGLIQGSGSAAAQPAATAEPSDGLGTFGMDAESYAAANAAQDAGGADFATDDFAAQEAQTAPQAESQQPAVQAPDPISQGMDATQLQQYNLYREQMTMG